MAAGYRRSRACALFALAALLPGNTAFSLSSPWLVSMRLGCAAVRLPPAAQFKQLRARSPASCVVMQRQREDEFSEFEAFSYEGLSKNPVALDPAGYAAALAVQCVPLLGFSDKYSHWLFFLGLATSTAYLGSRAPPLV